MCFRLLASTRTTHAQSCYFEFVVSLTANPKSQTHWYGIQSANLTIVTALHHTALPFGPMHAHAPISHPREPHTLVSPISGVPHTRFILTWGSLIWLMHWACLWWLHSKPSHLWHSHLWLRAVIPPGLKPGYQTCTLTTTPKSQALWYGSIPYNRP